jgi:hypothetical protein
MTFLHLTAGSDLLGKGIYGVGGCYNDTDGNTYKNPSALGPFERP